MSSVGVGADATSAGSESGEGAGWLREMIVHVHDALYPDGRYFEIPPSHPIYHSFYDFDVGFPGEDKMEMLDVPAPAWYFGKGQKDRRGLWGVELDGDLVAVFSDLGLSLSMGMGDETQGDSSVFGLMATTNIVIYALTRPAGLTTVRAQPAWKTFRPQTQLEALSPEESLEEVTDIDLFDVLGASLALVHAPLGSQMAEGGLRLRVDGRYSVELFKNRLNGLLLHNLPAGPHWIELEYGGESRQVDLELEGGRVLTATFSLDRIVFYRQLRLQLQEEQIQVEDWLGRFSDLQLEEMYYEEDWTEK